MFSSKYLTSCLHYLVNDYQQQLDTEAALSRLKDPSLTTNKHCLLDSKSNLLRYIVTGGNNTQVIEFFNQIIQGQEIKAMKQLEVQHRKTHSFAIIKPKNFEIKPKYFHTTSKAELLKQLKIKDRELGKLRKLQQIIDDCSRYRSWSLSQRELQQDKKIAIQQQRLASRECLYQVSGNTTPRQSRVKSVQKTVDYTVEIRRLEEEIATLEKQLKTLY